MEKLTEGILEHGSTEGNQACTMLGQAANQEGHGRKNHPAGEPKPSLDILVSKVLNDGIPGHRASPLFSRHETCLRFLRFWLSAGITSQGYAKQPASCLLEVNSHLRPKPSTGSPHTHMVRFGVQRT